MCYVGLIIWLLIFILNNMNHLKVIVIVRINQHVRIDDTTRRNCCRVQKFRKQTVFA